MKKLTVIGVVILFVAGLIPLLWLRPGYIISNGDNIPVFLNSEKTLTSATGMWSPDYLGYATPNPAYLLYTYLGAILGYLGLSVGSIQILIQILLYMGAGFSMYFLSKTIYPNHKIAPFFAAFFYLFNFFVLDSRFNLGFAWLYTFLPLLLALFVRIVNATYRGDKKSANIGIICFALVSVVALSVASVNPANIALFLFAMSVFAVYFLFKFRKNVLPFLFVIGKITAITIPINIWWIFPMLNTFIFSPAGLNSQVNVDSWSWTHARASFLNLFWFNGTWGWLPEYVPSSVLSFYSYPIVAVLMFVPFIVAASALLFKSSRSRFNAYIMACVLFFMFLAKGVHGPPSLDQLNLLLYRNISLMNMFREPASKFTLLIIPFLALLIGYAAENIANIKLKIEPNRLKSVKVLILLFLVASFVISSFPLLSGFVETKTEDLPFSSYIQIPQYWYQATNWINSQPGDWKVLLTPLNDYYQMPYTWGYYGSDQLLERLFEKPIVSTAALDGYVTNPSTSADLKQIRASVRSNQTAEFKALLDLLSIKYILQRNDVQSEFKYPVQRNDVLNDTIPRNLKSPSEMQSFFGTQPYLKLLQSFGKLDIYEYTEAKPSLFTILPSTLQKADVHINTSSILDSVWPFSSQNDIDKWKDSTVSNQWPASYLISQKTEQLEVNMSSLTSGWIPVNSPLLPAKIESSYQITVNATGINNRRVDIKIAEYSEDKTLLTNSTIVRIYGDFNSSVGHNYQFDYQFEPENSSTRFFRVQFWNYFDPTKTSNSSLLLDYVRVNGSVSTLDMTGLHFLNWGSLENPSAEVLHVQNISPEKIIVKVNATQPFILATTQTLDRFWVASVNGQQFRPTSIYLGLKGFMVNQTGQFDVTIEYEPQLEFNYFLAISGATVLILCIGLVYLNRKTIIGLIKKKQTKV